MNKSIVYLVSTLLLISLGCKPTKMETKDEHRIPNKLIDESSPYLLQHAYNPVEWYPWGDEALEKAKKEDKLIIISVGYAACHWCHVMEHESFEDSTVAAIMNEHFVCIKVDREERPDVDAVYMSACHLSSGRSCGWPLNAFALPDGRPVWAGTYFPKDQWTNILNQFKKLKETDQEKLNDSAEKITAGIENYERIEVNTADKDFTRNELNDIAEAFMKGIDFDKGGRKGTQKFPMPNNYEFLLKYNYLTGNQKAMDAVTSTLDGMALGGIYDQLGGGFARYCVDDIWLVPHFEKMLYDNGQLVSLYAHAFQKTQNPLYEKIVRETLEFIERELSDPTGGFYSSLDADSEGEEGKFYVWQKSEIDSILANEREAKIFNEFYSVRKNGNWEHTNILNVTKDVKGIYKEYNLTAPQLSEILDRSKKKLFAHRATRIRPGLDDKILTSWNGLMTSGYIDAYLALGDQHYLDQALKNANFITDKQMDKDFRLNRNYKNGKSSINGFLDDYALTIEAFIKLYQATFDEEWLNKAQGLADYSIAHFFKKENRMFNYTSSIDPPLIVTRGEIGDNVIPGSNSMMAKVLFHLGLYFDNQSYKDISHQMIKNVTPQIISSGQPNFYSNWCQIYLDNIQSPYEVAIVGENATTLRNELTKKYLGNSLLLGGQTEGSLALLKDKLQEGATMIYVCQNKVCKFPQQDAEKAFKLMQ